MKDLATIFESLNFDCSTEALCEDGSCTTLHYINNPDESVRWVWPSQLQKPLFLKFYSISSFKSRIIALLIELVFLLRLQSLVFKTVRVSLKQKNKSPLVDLTNRNWALFTGTAGPNRKAIIYKEFRNKKSFIKIGLNGRSNLLIQNEGRILRRLSTKEVTSFVFPQLLKVGKNILEVSDISCGGKRSTHFSALHLQAIKGLNKHSSLFISLGILPFWEQSKLALENVLVKKDLRIPVGLLKKLSLLIESIDDSTLIEAGYCHGDFTPWNIYEKNGELHIYDWELSQVFVPLGFDAFHFIIQKGILINRKPWAEIVAEIKEKVDARTLKNLSNKKESNVELYLKLYLITNIIYYLNIFSQQKHWNEQIHWSLKTWNEAISSLLANKEKHRSLILMDVFDFLLHKPYAALKFPNTFPEQLSEYADVDLCLDQTSAEALKSYVKNHPLVSKCMIVKKSYMIVLKLFCNDGTILCLDLIWELKRKATVLMELGPLINGATLNDYQVKTPKAKDLARFITLFYASNNTRIPEKYLSIAASLKDSTDIMDQQLYQIAYNNLSTSVGLGKLINNQSANRGLQKMRNRFRYVLDTMKEAISSPGMIITFSGVDGAGKSTIIDKVKYNLEKKLRKRVVVIRHRPSILPILSAWTKGKVTAEKEAASRLPRQGKNTNFFSSLFRFCYYYLDYLLGQFVIYFKYEFRGYVVLYDRYYFDFINDSKRSNIQLPAFLTRLGYNFLMKPNLNFFLYADPKLIRSRKKELDSETIERLTTKYKTLFKQLNERDAINSYVSIENIDLNVTLDSIINRINKHNTYAI
ncbi:MAG: thymidylate kinase [Gammaproteobacteria bacterium]|jgi:thymidylate kinase